MQTFLVYPSFVESAQCLDNKRLAKQRVEVLTILRVLAGEVKAWQHHPAVLQWKGHEGHLVGYGMVCCNEWRKRGYKDSCEDKIWELRQLFPDITSYPPWLGYPRFHDSHKSNLLRKNPEWYKQFNWNVPDNLPYYWPVRYKKGENNE